MGVLDDAIRQHIELKRRHGAGEDELKRKEQEALGPARREASAESERPAESERAGAEAAAADGDSPVDGDGAAAAPARFDGPFDEQETRVVPPPAREQAPARAAVDDWLEPDHEPDDEPLDDEPDDEPHDDEPLDDEPLDDAEPDDVLEETPEFLQETPEHDRLWFEQKPPRDFDFDDK